MEVVGKHFRPEFLNRVDESVVFHPLAKSTSTIAAIQLDHLKKEWKTMVMNSKFQKKRQANISLVFDPVYGARPLKEHQQTVENPLAKAILAGKNKSREESAAISE